MAQVKTDATGYYSPGESLVTSAERLGSGINELLATTDMVSVSFVGLRGVSSSYFNVLLQSIVAAHGIDVLNSRVKFVFETKAQEMVFDRSLQSVRSAVKVA